MIHASRLTRCESKLAKVSFLSQRRLPLGTTAVSSLTSPNKFMSCWQVADEAVNKAHAREQQKLGLVMSYGALFEAADFLISSNGRIPRSTNSSYYAKRNEELLRIGHVWATAAYKKGDAVSGRWELFENPNLEAGLKMASR